MARRTQRSRPELLKGEMVKALGSCRTACIQHQTRCIIGVPEYRGVEVFLRALDDLTGVLTGDRGHFLAPWHSTHPGMHVSCDEKHKAAQTDNSRPGAGSKPGPDGAAGGTVDV